MPPNPIHVTLHDGTAPPVRYRFASEAVSIGRAAGCDLVISDVELSREHARLQLRGDGSWELIDLGSRNGTWLNGTRLVAPARVADGDNVAVGRATLVLSLRHVPGASSLELATEDREGGGTADAVVAPVGPASLVGGSAAIAEVRAAIERMAPTAKTVLITGESGTGKELVAELLHARSPRAARPFIVINCPALAPSMLEAELFGVEKGAATGVEARIGLFETARGGTVFLDEIGDMDLAAQAKILRALQARTIERIGGRTRIALDVRIVAATHHDLEGDVGRGTFRGDLYHRLRVLSIRLPALRERREDIVPLAEYFLAREGKQFRLAEDAARVLRARDFPGNVRELEHLIASAVVASDGVVIEARHLHSPGAVAPGPAAPLDLPAELFSRIVERGEPFWEVVQEPYLRRELSRDDVRALIRRAYREGGGSYRGVARLFKLESQYQKLFDFLKNHDLRVSD